MRNIFHLFILFYLQNHTTYEAKLLIKTVTADQNSLTLVVESNLEDVVEYLLLFNSTAYFFFFPFWGKRGESIY